MIEFKQTEVIYTEEIEVLDYAEGNGDSEIKIAVPKMISKLQEAFERVPEKFRDNAVFKIWTYDESSSVYLRVEYQRPETAEEADAREAEYRRRRESEADHERQMYLRLKAKYG